MSREKAVRLGCVVVALAITGVFPAPAGTIGRQVATRAVLLQPGAATVTLPAGSVDGLADAIAAAGPGGTVLVEPGLHTESGTVMIGDPVTIVGEPGAVLEAETAQAAMYPLAVDPVLYVLDTSDVTIHGLEIRPPDGEEGGTAVLIENASDVTVSSNRIERHQFGVLVQHGDRAEVNDNDIAVSLTWAIGAVPEGHGVVVINGDYARVNNNRISGPLFGIWACDRKGRASGNELEGPGLTGLILCNVPEGNFLLPSGDFSGSEQPATQWKVHKNASSGFLWGYMVTDGSQENVLVNNAASGNADTDIEVLGDSYLFGFFTPTVSGNLISVGKHKQLRIRDCGAGTIVGGHATLVETEVEPCLCAEPGQATCL